MEISNITGCEMYFTPQKYWPKELLKKKFDGKVIFGMLRDPYERLIAQFRGNIKGYGSGWDPEDHKACNVNAALKKAMKQLKIEKANGNIFSSRCTYVPQADYFDGEYGIQVPVNNRAFPDTVHTLF